MELELVLFEPGPGREVTITKSKWQGSCLLGSDCTGRADTAGTAGKGLGI